MSDRWAVLLAVAVAAGAVAAIDGHVRPVPLPVALAALVLACVALHHDRHHPTAPRHPVAGAAGPPGPAAPATPGPARGCLGGRRQVAVGAPGPAAGGLAPGSPAGGRASVAGAPGPRAAGATSGSGSVPGCLGGAGRRGPALLCLAGALLAMALAQRSLAGLGAPLDTGPVTREVVLVGDPAPDGGGGTAVDVRLGHRRLRAVARGAAGAALAGRLAGERAAVVGTVAGPGRPEQRQPYRHLAGRLDVTTVAGWRPGDGISRAANGLRRTLAAGARVLPARQRSLLAGLTLGDDRDQPPDMTDAFRAAGLSHLLAVSGENVAFALLIVAPVLSRLRFGPRLALTLAALAGFALLTRSEPSVLRATAMAAVAATGLALGRPASAARTLALGVAGIVLIDPLLVTSVGFRLSVAGTAGIVAAAPRLEAALPGPRWLAAPLSVTLAAQAAVAPLLVATFGSVPLASVPANLLAVPVAGPVMVWGLTAGMVAGVAPTRVALLLHVPTRVLLAWLDGVARAAAAWPLGTLRAPHLLALAAGGAVLVAARHLRPAARPVLQAAAGATTALACLVPVAVARAPDPAAAGPHPLAAGATLWHDGGAAVVILDGRASPGPVLAGLRDHGVRHLQVAVLRTAAPRAAAAAAILGTRWPGLAVLAPAPGPPPGTRLQIGHLRLVVRANDGTHLDVEVTDTADTSAAATTTAALSPGARDP